MKNKWSLLCRADVVWAFADLSQTKNHQKPNINLHWLPSLENRCPATSLKTKALVQKHLSLSLNSIDSKTTRKKLIPYVSGTSCLTATSSFTLRRHTLEAGHKYFQLKNENGWALGFSANVILGWLHWCSGEITATGGCSWNQIMIYCNVNLLLFSQRFV